MIGRPSIWASVSELEEQLKTVLDREAETHRRHDEELDALHQQNEALRLALRNIAEETSAEDDAGENYRWDDREGALDYAYAVAIRALDGATDNPLIAAAPELLAELDCRAGDLFLLRKAIEACDPTRELLVRIDDMIRETRAAIAKARGGV